MKKNTGEPGRKAPASARLLRVIPAVVFAAAFVLLAHFLAQPMEGDAPTSASQRVFAAVQVTNVIEDNAQADDWTEGLRLGSQLLEVEVLQGEHKGERLVSPNYLSAYYNIDAKVGARIIVRLAEDDNGLLYVASFVNYDRGPVLVGFVVFFAIVLIAVGGKQGLKALFGLVFTLTALWFVLIPLLMRGADPILTTIGLTALTAGVSLAALTGYTRKTLCALIGCVGGVAVAGGLAALVGHLTPLSGFNMPEAEELVLRASDHGLTIRGLLVCGVLIASLGAVMDVAMSIASSCNELRELNPELTMRALFRSGMNIGRDAMGTMANTLILAFVGSSLNALILFRAYDYPSLQILNSDMMAIEIVQGIAGSTGIVLTVPVVAGVSAWVQTSGFRSKRP